MRVITLVPIKNESWILRFALTNFSLFSDEIILLDDSSTDSPETIVHNFPKARLIPFRSKEAYVNMSERRNTLLKEGRAAGGTHFIFLDADETISSSWIPHIHARLAAMNPGETICLPWITVHAKDSRHTYDPKDESNYKDFVFCDDGAAVFPNQALSEARTPPTLHTHTKIPFADGFVLHFQYLAPQRVQLKQAWYRIQEYLEGKRHPIRVNATYAYTKGVHRAATSLLNDAFLQENSRDIHPDIDIPLFLARIQNIFREKGVAHFESLDIWDIPELRMQFIAETHREPHPTVAPSWLLKLNDIKNIIRNTLRKVFPHIR